jgi:hypothetical protein
LSVLLYATRDCTKYFIVITLFNPLYDFMTQLMTMVPFTDRQMKG